MVAKLAVAKVAVKVVAPAGVKEEAAPEQEDAGQAVAVVLAAVESDLVDLIRKHSPTRCGRIRSIRMRCWALCSTSHLPLPDGSSPSGRSESE